MLGSRSNNSTSAKFEVLALLDSNTYTSCAERATR